MLGRSRRASICTFYDDHNNNHTNIIYLKSNYVQSIKYEFSRIYNTMQITSCMQIQYMMKIIMNDDEVL